MHQALPASTLILKKVTFVLVALSVCLSFTGLAAGGNPPSPKAHWAFQSIKHAPPPKVKQFDWIRTTVDRYVVARLEQERLRPQSSADRRTLIRRVTYDLTGLPPTPEAVEAFVRDDSPRAYPNLVERLLASPAYGEKWGRMWLDVVRYADTAGENSDHPVPDAWRYRNWVIQAFNDDLPYDQFLREQIAGDILWAKAAPEARDPGLIIATGYLAIARRFGHDIDKDMHLTFEDTIDTLGKSVLGLTLGCARCHDHKYDPVSTADYYGLYGILQSTRFAFPGCEPRQEPHDLVPLMAQEQINAQLKPWKEKASRLDAQIAAMERDASVLPKKLKAMEASCSHILSEANVAEGASVELSNGQRAPLDQVTVRKGEVLQLSVLPNASHGADSTRVEWNIKEVGGLGREWSVADLIPKLTFGNPHPGNLTNATWCFLDTIDGPAFLASKVDVLDGHPELQVWRNADTPSVFVNSSDHPVKVWTTLPPRSFFVHPGPKGPVAVVWLSPMDGVVSISGLVADAHPSSSDGVAFRLEHFTDPEMAPQLVGLGGSSQLIAEAKEQRTKELGPEPVIPVAYAVAEGKPANAPIQKRGEPDQPGDVAQRKNLDLLGGQPMKQGGSGRLDLADWFTAPSNPLTARVMINRIWQGHFGRGLVATPNDFGTRGQPPTHPELLDYLAGEFVKSGWSIKAMHRLILLSAVYQQASGTGAGTDLYAAFPRRRLTAEELRDTLLTISDELDPAQGGPYPFPPVSDWKFTQHNPFADSYATRQRSVYVMSKRNRRDPFFALFDGADPNSSTPTRAATTVPTQALFFMNAPLVHEQAQAFARRLLSLPVKDDGARVDAAFEIALQRHPSRSEHDRTLALVRAFRAAEAQVPETERERSAWSACARMLIGSNEFLFID